MGKRSDRVAPNEVTTRAAGGRRGAADSFDLVGARIMEAALYDREESECAAPWDLSEGGIFHLSANSLWTRPAAPARLSRALCAAVTPSRPVPSPLTPRVYVIALPCSRSRRKEGTRAEKRHDDGRKSFYGTEVSNAPTPDHRVSLLSFENLTEDL